MPVNPSDKCPSTLTRSAVTCSRPPDANTCADHAEQASSTFAAAYLNTSSRPCWISMQRNGQHEIVLPYARMLAASRTGRQITQVKSALESLLITPCPGASTTSGGASKPWLTSCA